MNKEKAAFVERATKWLMPNNDPVLRSEAEESNHLGGIYKGKSMRIHRMIRLAYLRGCRRGAGLVWDGKQPVRLRLASTDAPIKTPQYLIWSNDAGAWWNPGRAGYTGSTADAGRYSRVEALRIACHGRDGWNPIGVSPEVPVLESDVLEIEELQRQRKANRQRQHPNRNTDNDIHG